MPNKRAETSFPLLDLLAERWSPLAFDDCAVEPQKLGSLLEAARWAPSSYNEQPWRFLVATRDDSEGFDRIASCLVPGNSWAHLAPVLMVPVAKEGFDRNGQPNPHAWHDVGLAVALLTVQAQALSLVVHQMAGFDAERARTVLGIPEGHAPVSVVAIGYPGVPEMLPEAQRRRELAPRSRRPLDEVVRGAAWDQPLRKLATS